MHNQISLEQVQNALIAGRGGKEGEILKAFPHLKRAHGTHYDFLDRNGNAYECKKQQDMQWFDHWKYHEMGPERLSIKLLFVFHKLGKIRQLAVIQNSTFIETVMNDPLEPSWTDESLRLAFEYHQKFPKVQFKAPIKMLQFVGRHREAFDEIIEFERGL